MLLLLGVLCSPLAAKYIQEERRPDAFREVNYLEWDVLMDSCREIFQNSPSVHNDFDVNVSSGMLLSQPGRQTVGMCSVFKPTSPVFVAIRIILKSE